MKTLTLQAQNHLILSLTGFKSLLVVTPPEDLNVKFLRSLPSKWDTHVVVWMNKPNFDTIGLDDLYNNFKIIEQKVKKFVGTNNDDKNLAFLTTSGASSTNSINTVNPELVLRTGRKIIIDGSSIAGYDKSKVKCFNCHKIGHFFKECMSHLGVKTNKIENQGSSTKTLKIEDASEKANVVPKDGLEEFKEPEVNEYGPRDSSLKPTTGCDKESDNSKENTDDSLEQHQMTDTETSSFESPLKSNSQLNDKGFVDSGCSRHMTRNIAHLSDFKDFDGGYVTFGRGAYGGRITGKGTIKTDNLDFDNVRAVKN
ncbi:ribonuclease H-like domain-containing protein [Tanacetum coccineum]